MALSNIEPGKSSTSSEPRHGVSLSTVMHVCESLRRVFSSPSYSPPMLPNVALQIHQLSCNADIDTNRLIEVLERDPMLAGYVLKVANSPAFRGRDPETSLRTAVLRLGLKNLGEIVFELALHMRVFRSVRYSQAMEDLRKHSTACGNLARMLAVRTGRDPEMAFLCGLMHDIGIAGILIVLGEDNRDPTPLNPVILDEVVRQTHEEISAMLVGLWKLPPEVIEVVGKHHSAALAEGASPLAPVVALADHLAGKLGYGVDLGAGGLDGRDAGFLASLCAGLGMDAEKLKDVESEAGSLVRVVNRAQEIAKAVEVEKPGGAHASESGASLRPAKAAVQVSARKHSKGFWAGAWRMLFGGGPKK